MNVPTLDPIKDQDEQLSYSDINEWMGDGRGGEQGKNYPASMFHA